MPSDSDENNEINFLLQNCQALVTSEKITLIYLGNDGNLDNKKHNILIWVHYYYY